MDNVHKENILYWVKLPYATFGVVVRMGMVVSSAPIAKWAVGKNYQVFAQWVVKKGGSLRKVN